MTKYERNKGKWDIVFENRNKREINIESKINESVHSLTNYVK